MTNLQILFQETEILDMESRCVFDDYLIGALSIIVNKEDWQSALRTTRRMMAIRSTRIETSGTRKAESAVRP